MTSFSTALVIISLLVTSVYVKTTVAPGDLAPTLLMIMALIGSTALFFRR